MILIKNTKLIKIFFYDYGNKKKVVLLNKSKYKKIKNKKFLVN